MIHKDINNLVEPTSGNTGLGLIHMGNQQNLKSNITISNKVPEEKRSKFILFLIISIILKKYWNNINCKLKKKAIMKFFGARVIEVSDDLWPRILYLHFLFFLLLF